MDKTVRIWDAETGEVRKVLEGHSHCVYSVSLSQDGKTVASGCYDNTIRIWDVETVKVRKVL